MAHADNETRATARRHVPIIGAVLAALAVTLVATVAAAGAATPTPRWIVFSATPPGIPSNQLFRIQTSGKGLQQITTGAIPSTAPAFSPDGKRIAFVRTGAGIFLIDANGTGVRRITDNGRDAFPTWSPDGKQIAYLRVVGSDWTVWVMSSSGAGQHRLAKAPSAGRPTWTKSGLLLSTGGDMTRIDPATGKVLGYLNVDIDASFGLMTAAASPDASTVAFVGSRRADDGDMDCGDGPCQRYALYVVAAGKGTPRLLVRDTGPAAFSPDGKTLAFHAKDGLTLWTLADGSSRTVRTGNAYMTLAAAPAWQPR